MAVKIKLMRMGKIRAPYYRIVVADARTKRDGRAIEQIGKYHPKQEPSLIEIDSERAQHWLSVGAQPTSPVLSLLKVTGDWQKFRGEPGSEGTLKTAAARPDKKEAFAAALREVHGESTTEASKPKSRGKKSDAGAKAEKAAEQAGKASDKAGKAAEKAGEAGKAGQDAKAGTGEHTAEAKTENAKSGAAGSTGSKRRDAGRSSEKAAAADADPADSATASESGSGA